MDANICTMSQIIIVVHGIKPQNILKAKCLPFKYLFQTHTNMCYMKFTNTYINIIICEYLYPYINSPVLIHQNKKLQSLATDTIVPDIRHSLHNQ